MEGYAIGFIVGLACGIAIGRHRKTWSEMTDTEKRLMIGSIVVGVIALIAGIVVYFQVAT